MLRAEGIHASYGPVEVLHGVDLDVGDGELVSVLGANGAGKTTLLGTISGLLPLDEGTVVVDGQDLSGRPSHERYQAGVIHVPEGRKLFPQMSVQENLELGAPSDLARDERSRTMAEIYERFPILTSRRRQLAGTLSGGEQQQLAIGRGLMGRPRIMLLDEPTLGLAPVLADEILQIVVDLNAEGMTVLLVSQEVVGALEISDRAYVLENGDVAMSGDASELARRDDIRMAYLGL